MDFKMQSTQSNSQHTENLIFELKQSGAPRFLMSMFQLPEGLHTIQIDNEYLPPENQIGRLEIWYEGEDRRVSLVHVNTFEAAAAKAQELEPVYTFFDIIGDRLSVSHGTEQSAPEQPQYIFQVQDLANLTSIEDFCELTNLKMVANKSGTEPIQTEGI